MSHISIYQRFLLPNPLHTCKVSLPLQPQKQNGAIAQLVEQRTENPCVPGSIPGGTTFKKLIIKQLSKLDDCFFLYISSVSPMI